MIRIALALQALALTTATTISGQQSAGPALPDWWRSGVCYEIFVRSFFDSDGDGIGDLNGLIQKLDYINDGDPLTQQDLGARCIWLMPIAQSPSYHGYDVTNYYRVDGDYGSNEDFKRLVVEAHHRGIRVLVDMVLNHASSEHPYFKHALLYPDSPYREWFVWLPEHPAVKNPWGGDNWHRSPVREEYYYGFFWHGMPDLNYESQPVRDEAKKIATFWLKEMGVDGFRLDAIKFLVEAEQGRVVEHLPATHDFLREYGAHIRRIAPGAFTIGEVWDSTGAFRAYYPDQLDAYFLFDVADALIESVRSGSAERLHEAALRAVRDLPPGRWSPFLRNHDQTRTATELGADPGRLRVAATLLLTLPGLPFLYYGEEIGMTGAKPDPRLRTPMQWSLQPAAGFTRGVPWEPLQPDSFTANVESQERDPASLLNHHRRLIHLRAAHPALAADGEFIPLSSSHPAAAAYLRRADGRTALVLVNLGDRPVLEVALSSAEAVLPPGRYTARTLLGGATTARLRVGGDGQMRRWTPLRALQPYESHVIEIAEEQPR